MGGQAESPRFDPPPPPQGVQVNALRWFSALLEGRGLVVALETTDIIT